MTLARTGNPSVRRYFLSVIAFLFVLLNLPLGAHQNPPASVQKFVARTELVTVPVIVLSHGKHVTGLPKGDFEIEEDGHPMTLATFEEVGLAQSAKPISPPPGIYTNEVLSDGPVTMTIIALDLINTPYLNQEPVKRELLDYLQHSYRADRPTMLAILSRSGLRVIHDFTNDPQVLETLVRHLKRDGKHDLESDAVVQKDDSGTLLQQIDVSAEYEALEKEFFGDPSVTQGKDSFDKFIADNDRETTLLELRQLARGLSSVPGMKSLIWVSGGIVLPRIMDTRSLRLVDEYEETWKLLNAATIVVTPIDTVLESSNAAFRDTMHMLPDPSRSTHLSLTPEIQRIQNFWDLAQRTGGDYCLMRRDRHCFQKMSDLTSHYYLLTYYVKPSDRSQWRKIRVKVRGENLDVKARNGYYSVGLTGDPEERRKRDVAEASQTPVEFRGVPISARWSDSGGKAEKPSAGTSPFLERRNKRNFQLGIAPGALSIDEADGNHIRLHIVVLAMNDKGKVLNDLTQQLDLHPTREELQRIRTHGFLYGNEMEIPAASTRLRFIVRDDLSENVGTVSMPVM
ncbi:MAG TPA: VWA domain-containing protein [Terriglobales bacterium]|jgi:VWFA-related protein|nr:VWA domain-containing protein [Terriglobales bacterium]